MPKLISDDFLHSTPAASLGVVVPVKTIEIGRNKASFQNWNVRGVFFSSDQKELGWVKSLQVCKETELGSRNWNRYTTQTPWESAMSKEIKTGQKQGHGAKWDKKPQTLSTSSNVCCNQRLITSYKVPNYVTVTGNGHSLIKRGDLFSLVWLKRKAWEVTPWRSTKCHHGSWYISGELDWKDYPMGLILYRAKPYF